jgi:hypothetical protein
MFVRALEGPVLVATRENMHDLLSAPLGLQAQIQLEDINYRRFKCKLWKRINVMNMDSAEIHMSCINKNQIKNSRIRKFCK